VAVVLTIAAALFGTEKLPPEVYVGLFAGIFIGVCQDIRAVLVQLDQYDESVAALERKITSLEQH
jgi:hypothetical protein